MAAADVATRAPSPTRADRVLLGVVHAPATGTALAGVYGFLAVALFVLSMGVPVPQLALGLVAGVVAGRSGLDGTRTRLLTAGVLAALGVLSALLAIARPSTAYDLQRSLGLPFDVTPGMVLGLVVVGGPLLLAAQWVCTTAGLRLATHHRVPLVPGTWRVRPTAHG